MTLQKVQFQSVPKCLFLVSLREAFLAEKQWEVFLPNKQEKTFCIKLQIKRTLSLYYNVADDQTMNTQQTKLESCKKVNQFDCTRMD